MYPPKNILELYLLTEIYREGEVGYEGGEGHLHLRCNIEGDSLTQEIVRGKLQVVIQSRLPLLSLLIVAPTNNAILVLDVVAYNISPEIFFAASVEHQRFAGHREFCTVGQAIDTAFPTLPLGPRSLHEPTKKSSLWLST